jgi:hypothetical protein
LRLALRYLALRKNSNNMKTPTQEVASGYEGSLTFCNQKMNPIKVRGVGQ